MNRREENGRGQGEGAQRLVRIRSGATERGVVRNQAGLAICTQELPALEAFRPPSLYHSRAKQKLQCVVNETSLQTPYQHLSAPVSAGQCPSSRPLPASAPSALVTDHVFS